MVKLHILDWLEGVHLPGIDREQIDYNHLLRSLDFLIADKAELEPKLAGPILTLFDAPLDLVFYDLTSCYFEIERADKVKNPSFEPDKPSSACTKPWPTAPSPPARTRPRNPNPIFLTTGH